MRIAAPFVSRVLLSAGKNVCPIVTLYGLDAQRGKEYQMGIETIVIIVVLVILLGGGGYYWRGRR